MNTFYTNEKHTQILIALMKKHGIKKIIPSSAPHLNKLKIISN